MAKSMSMNLASGLQGMLKEGHTSYDGVDEAILRNINAAKELAAIVRTSLGPNGERNKLSSAAFSFRIIIAHPLYAFDARNHLSPRRLCSATRCCSCYDRRRV